MNKSLQLMAIQPKLQPQSQWIESSSHVYSRDCIGQEHSASYNQNIADGHTELSIALTFSINTSISELLQRCTKAWISCRVLHPEVAVELSEDLAIPQRMTYRVLHLEKEVKSWVKDTFVIVDTSTAEDTLEMTYNRRLKSKGKQSMMYLIPDKCNKVELMSRKHSLIWNVSHAVTDSYSIVQFLNTFMSEITRANLEESIHQTSHPEIQDGSIASHLPISPLISHEEMYKPTLVDKQKSLQEAKDQLELYQSKLSESISMYPEEDYSQRRHYTHCLITRFSLQDSTTIMTALKESQIGITYAGAAATILATFQLYGKGNEKGALLGMTRNARRWIAAILPSTGRLATPMATDVVFLWIPFNIEVIKNSKRFEIIITLAKEIKNQLKRHLSSPHYLSSVPYISGIFVENLRAREDHRLSKDGIVDLVGPSSPGFSSQGALQLEKTFKNDKVILIRHDLWHSGRQVGTSPWIGMFSLDDCLRFSIGFDAKYYRPEKMSTFLTLVRENVMALSGKDIDAPRPRPVIVSRL